MRFPCTGCGACCRVINRYEELIVRDDPSNPYYFPFQWDESGKCENLEGNKCKVYEDRPLICNIEAFLEALGLDKIDFYNVNIKSCHELVDEFGLGEEMKPKIDN